MKVIALTGKKQHGKDTVCQFIAELVGKENVLRFAFADALKRECADLLGITVAEIEADKARFRGLLQWFGTEWRRHDHPEYWVEQVHDHIVTASATNKGKLAVITDCRYPNEADMVKKFGGVIVRVVRLNCHPCPDDPHPSEQAMNAYPADYTITASNLEELKTETERMLHANHCLFGGSNQH